MTTRRTPLTLPLMLVAILTTAACSFAGSVQGADNSATSSSAVRTSSSVPTSSSSPTATSDAPTTGPTSTGTAPPGTSSAPSSAPPAPTGAGTPDRCHTSELTGTLSASDAGAGQRYSTLTLTNSGGDTCTVHGYGGLGLTDGSGRQLPTSQLRVPSPAPTTVTLPPGGSVSAQLHWSAVPGTGDSPSGPCQPTAATLQVIPPDETDALPVTWTGGPVCERGTIRQSAYAAP